MASTAKKSEVEIYGEPEIYSEISQKVEMQ